MGVDRRKVNCLSSLVAFEKPPDTSPHCLMAVSFFASPIWWSCVALSVFVFGQFLREQVWMSFLLYNVYYQM